MEVGNLTKRNWVRNWFNLHCFLCFCSIFLFVGGGFLSCGEFGLYGPPYITISNDLRHGSLDMSLVTPSVSPIYLKHIFIQQPCSKHGNTLSADVGVVTSEQVKGVQLLTVQVESHWLPIHTVGYSVPTSNKERRKLLYPKLLLVEKVCL